MSREAINIIIIIIVGAFIFIDISDIGGVVRGGRNKLGETFRPGTVREEAYHGGLGGMGGENAMVVGVSNLDVEGLRYKIESNIIPMLSHLWR